MALTIQRLNFDPVTGDNASEAFMKLDLDIGEIVEAIDGDGDENPGIESRLGDAEMNISDIQLSMPPGDLYGLYATRPDADSVPSGTIYYASDVLEAYRSNGTVWSVLPTSGGELGYSEKTTITSTTSTVPVDVAGLTVTCKVGEKPVMVTYGGAIRHHTASSIFILQLVYDTTQTKASQVVGTGGYIYLERRTRISGLVPGQTYTFKLQFYASSAGTVDLYGDSSDRPFIRVANT